jgi:hypothetical protein
MVGEAEYPQALLGSYAALENHQYDFVQRPKQSLGVLRSSLLEAHVFYRFAGILQLLQAFDADLQVALHKIDGHF